MMYKSNKIQYENGMVITSSEMIALEEKILKDKTNSIDKYMKTAATEIFAIANKFIEEKRLNNHMILLCGKGNNCGDAIAIGILAAQKNIRVTAFFLFPIDQCSELIQNNIKIFKKNDGEIVFLKNIDEFFIEPNSLIVDGIFGIGFKGKIDGLVFQVIERVNQSPNNVLAIDIPSGVNGDTGIVETIAIMANKTASLGLLKVGHLYNDGYNYSGDLHNIDFNIQKKYLDELNPYGYLINPEIINYNMPLHKRTANKYEIGKVAIIGGSMNMPGAPILASRAALRSGAGVVELFFPPDVQMQLAQLPSEILRSLCDINNIDRLSAEMHRINAIVVGPGIGRSDSVPIFLKKLYSIATCPLIIDGDALYFFNEFPISGVIITPHKGELCKILNISTKRSDIEIIDMAENLAKQKNLIIVYKGAPTTLLFPNRKKLIIPYGNIGMATAGTGDVLTGIIASMIAQGKSIEEGAILGATIHAIAGDEAKNVKSARAMIASDIIIALSSIFSRN